MADPVLRAKDNQTRLRHQFLTYRQLISQKSAIGSPCSTCNHSYYQGIPCVYVDHSRIEYIFVDKQHLPLILNDKESSDSRRYCVEDLDEKLFEFLDDKENVTAAHLKAFVVENRESFVANRVMLSTLLPYRCDYLDKAVAIDRKVILPAIYTDRKNSSEPRGLGL